MRAYRLSQSIRVAGEQAGQNICTLLWMMHLFLIFFSSEFASEILSTILEWLVHKLNSTSTVCSGETVCRG